jgi:hypothetical protein
MEKVTYITLARSKQFGGGRGPEPSEAHPGDVKKVFDFVPTAWDKAPPFARVAELVDALA